MGNVQAYSHNGANIRILFNSKIIYEYWKYMFASSKESKTLLMRFIKAV